MRIKALKLEKDRAEGQDHEQQPLEFGERPDRILKSRKAPGEGAQRVREPERKHHQQTVGDLEELEIQFLFSTEHRVFCACNQHDQPEEFE